ncbi:MAG TPA: C39 family peptidase [Pirellulaceae bacterium]
MEHVLEFVISPQPDLKSCGPTCLHAIYRYFGDPITLEEVIRETEELEGGGTLAVLLGCHALRRGYSATVYTYDLDLFDPTWFRHPSVDMADKLRRQMEVKGGAKYRLASEAFVDFLERGGEVRMEDISSTLLRKYLTNSVPILGGLSSTYLYNERREVTSSGEPDDVRGEPQGHFVVLCGYDSIRREVLIADPLCPNPLAVQEHYSIPLGHVIASIMLGIVTYDANLLVIQPVHRRKGTVGAHADHHG